MPSNVLYNQNLKMWILNVCIIFVLLAVCPSSERQLSGRFKRASEQKVIVPLKNRGNTQYTFEIFIGTPEQMFCVQIDTGSFDLWVHSTVSRDGKIPTRKFNRGLSKTIKNVNNDKFNLKYGDGAVYDGDLVADLVTLRGRTTEVKIRQQVFGLVTSHSNADNLDADGILGLGLKGGSQFSGKPDPTIYSLMNQFGFEPQIGIFLNRNDDGMEGELVFGGINEDLVEGEFTFTEIPPGVGQYNWAVMVDRIAVNGVTIPNSKILAILDSGASQILGPRAIINGINGGLWRPSQEFWKQRDFRCSNVEANNLPDVTFYIKGNAFNLPSEAYISKYASGGSADYEAIMKTIEKYQIPEDQRKQMLGSSQSTCQYVIAVDPSENYYPANTRLIILGVPFMRQFYTQMNYNEKIIGLAKARRGTRQMPKPTITKPPSRERVARPPLIMPVTKPGEDSGAASMGKPAAIAYSPSGMYGKPTPNQRPPYQTGAGAVSYGLADKPSPQPLPSGDTDGLTKPQAENLTPREEQKTTLQPKVVQPAYAPSQESPKQYVHSGNVFVRSYRRITSYFSYLYNTMLVALLNIITR